MTTKTAPTGPAAAKGALAAAATALRLWSLRRWATAIVATAVIGGVIGLSTVLIPNPWFRRDIPTEPWNYPVWIVVSALTGMLFATYLRADRSSTIRGGAAAPGEEQAQSEDGERTSRRGTLGAILAWFAVGCPVCNKIALLAFGYSGAITWFAPAQPYLAAAAVLLTVVALTRRLQGEVSCPMPLRGEVAS